MFYKSSPDLTELSSVTSLTREFLFFGLGSLLFLKVSG